MRRHGVIGYCRGAAGGGSMLIRIYGRRDGFFYLAGEAVLLYGTTSKTYINVVISYHAI
ncbi:hypothetical protein AGMMS49546_34200 [Spirochaetia bacterium]|nr:hypothetical protein AGMMS49546_34200 [Spirochaetia bacterium]